jgi:hypothetical protein
VQARGATRLIQPIGALALTQHCLCLLLLFAIVLRVGSCSFCSRPSRSSKQTTAKSAPDERPLSGSNHPTLSLFFFSSTPFHFLPPRSIRLPFLAHCLQFMRPAPPPRRKSRRSWRLHGRRSVVLRLHAQATLTETVSVNFKKFMLSAAQSNQLE